MASKLYISEFEDPRAMQSFPMQVAFDEGGSIDSVVDYSGGAAQSAAFATTTKFIRVHTDSICSIKIGGNPTATTANRRMAAGQTEYWGVRAGQKISAIINT